MKTSRLSFKKKFQPKHNQDCSDNRTYIDFEIDGVSLADLIGDTNNKIGKFGWKTNIDFELLDLEELRAYDKSRLENELFSIYVCAECRDEGCGAVMFEKYQTAEIIEWKNFVWSNGYEDEIVKTERIPVNDFRFERAEYEIAMKKLRKLIIED